MSGFISLDGSEIIEDVVRFYTMQGKAFSATTGKSASPAGGTNQLGFQLLNPISSTKNILIYSLVLTFNGSNIHTLNVTNVDANTLTGWADTACNIVNNAVGNPNTSVAKSSFSNTAITGFVGTTREMSGTQNGVPVEILTNGECIWLPANDAASLRGIVLFIGSGAAGLAWGVTCNYLEF